MATNALDVLTLLLTPGVGPAAARRLLEALPTGAFEGLSRRWLRAAGLAPSSVDHLRSGSSRRLGEEELKRIQDFEGQLLVYGAPDYPHLLARIPDPPLALWTRGDIELLYKPAIAIVGARNCSIYGSEVAHRFGQDLAGLGLVIVSGLARGVDRAAHEGSLQNSGVTVAVLGTGLDVTYPRSHRRLQQRIAHSGCLVTEFRLSTTPRPGNFPARNRIISGLCVGTIVVEGSRKSGALITAGSALDQNRELWAVPGNVTNRLSEGPNRLIQQGAQPVLDAHDVLGRLPGWALEDLRAATPEAEIRLEPDERRLLNLLDIDRASQFDELVEGFQGGASELSSALLELQMKGLVRAMAGDRFSRTWCGRSQSGGSNIINDSP